LLAKGSLRKERPFYRFATLTRVAAYVDGFNLYHAIAALGDPMLKWADLRSLAASYLRQGDTLERVAFYTAYNTWDPGKRQRHLSYVNALTEHGVEVVLSKFAKITKVCAATGNSCHFREEKRTDVAIATDMLSDCYERGIERILLVTADSDQIPAVEHIRRRFPNVSIYMIAPPKRLSNARELSSVCHGKTELTAGRIRDHQLPHEVRNAAGRLVATCPAMYGPHRQA
jgi:uncharacterized LabA/DUF88 family protein